MGEQVGALGLVRHLADHRLGQGDGPGLLAQVVLLGEVGHQLAEVAQVLPLIGARLLRRQHRPLRRQIGEQGSLRALQGLRGVVNE